MKTIKIISICLLIFALAISGLNMRKTEHLYSICATVIEVNSDGTIFEDTNGTLWSVYDTDFVIGECVTLQMNDNGTSDYNQDDYIKEIK